MIVLHAETVFVYIDKGDFIIEKKITEDSRTWINSIENGILDTLFENGHIVFSGNSGANQIKDFEKLNQLAKSGGAKILISTVLNFSITNSDVFTTTGEYTVYNLFTDDIIYSGKYDFNDIFKSSEFYVEEKLFSIGQFLGNDVVKHCF
jgi:hypothetical protein